MKLSERKLTQLLKSIEYPEITPDPYFKEALQRKLLRSIPHGEVKNARKSWLQFNPAYLVATLAGLIILVSISQSSTPKDMLYPLKIASERSALSLTPTLEVENYLKTIFFQRRLNEIEILKKEGREDLIQTVLDQYQGLEQQVKPSLSPTQKTEKERLDKITVSPIPLVSPKIKVEDKPMIQNSPPVLRAIPSLIPSPSVLLPTQPIKKQVGKKEENSSQVKGVNTEDSKKSEEKHEQKNNPQENQGNNKDQKKNEDNHEQKNNPQENQGHNNSADTDHSSEKEKSKSK